MAKSERSNSARSFLFSRAGFVLLGFIAVAGYFLWTEHEAHLKGFIPYLPFLLLLACPLMHLFMHHGHSGHGDHNGGDEQDPSHGPSSGWGRP